MDNEIFSGPELLTTTSGISNIMVAGCIVPVEPNKSEYVIYSPYMNQDYVSSMELLSNRKNGPTLALQFKNIKNKNFYVFLMQCTPFLSKGKIDAEHCLACACFGYVAGDVAVNYDFYIYNTNEQAAIRTDCYYTFFMPCIE